MDEFEALAGDLLKPLDGGSGVGVDARHEADHEAVRAELEKLNSMAKATMSWERVDQLTTRLLQTTSKDLLIASYGAGAWLELSGASALARGLATLGGLLARFPRALFPVRARARANALSWFVDRAADKLRELDTSGLDSDKIRELTSVLRATASTARDVLGDDSPSFSSLQRAVERLALTAPEPKREEPPLPVAAASDAASKDNAPEPPAAVVRSETPGAGLTQLLPHPAAGNDGSGGGAERIRAAAWLQPLSGAARAGADLTYEDAFAELQTLIAQLESPGAKPPDWKHISTTSQALLRTQSKDLLVASYLAAALLELEGISGLATGLWLVVDLSERFWEDMWPPLVRLRRRASALEWLIERASARLAAFQPAASHRAALASLNAALIQLTTDTLPRFGVHSPKHRPLTDAVARVMASLPSEAPVVAPAPAVQPSDSSQMRPPAAPVAPVAPPPAAAAPAMVLPEAPAATPSDAAQVGPFLRSIGERLVQTARILRAANKADPTAYRLARQGAWLHLEQAPPRDGERRTRIPAPQKRVVDTLAALHASEKWEPLLAQAEASVATAPLWLDLHWYVARALTGLGAEHAAAHDAVERETRALLLRLPDLADACFQDGSPLASAETRAWLKPPQAREAPQESAAYAGLSAEHLVLAAAGTRESLATVQGAIAGHAAELNRFLCRLDLAQALAGAGRAVQALAVYRGLARDIDVFGLERWDPALAGRTLTAYWECLRGRESPDGVVSDEAKRLCATLARLNPGALI